MINRRDVITIKVPFPNISSGLAVKAHMYICQYSSGNEKRLLKCQTMKPYMLSQQSMRHFWDEEPDISRNPFQCKTRIDCEKLFVTVGAVYSARLRTSLRPDVCEDVISHAEAELFTDGYSRYNINIRDLTTLNTLIATI